MINPRGSFCILTLAAVVFLSASLPRACADDAADQAAAVTLLTSGPWIFSTKGSNDSWTFAKDGTFTTASKMSGHWTMTKDSVILTFPSGHKDSLTLPLNPKGTACMADDGSTMIAVMVNAPAVAASTLVFLPPNPAAHPVSQALAKAMVKAVLIDKPWKFVGSWWYAIRSFSPDGTFKTIVNGGDTGDWDITDTQVILTFSDGHKDIIKLPLDPQGSEGLDRDGKPVTVIQGDVPVANPTPTPAAASTSALAYLKATPTPGPQQLAQQNAATAALLVSAPWKFTGGSWSTIHIFAKDGTFTSIDKPNEFGKWKIEGNKVLLTFADSHTDAMLLPLNPKGTDSIDQGGGIDICIMQDNAPGGAAPTPAPTILTAPPPALAAAGGPAASAPAPTPRGPIPSKAVTAALLTAKPWKFVAGWWYAIRKFSPDGTFKGIANGGGDGTWQITDTAVILLFPNGGRDTMLLPLNPQGSDGIDGRNEPILLVQGDVPVADPTPTPAARHTSALDSLGTSFAPATAGQNSVTASALLVSAPWKYIAHSYSVIRIFAKDGTFTTIDRPKEYGTWKASTNKIILTFGDATVELMLLPLNPKGTDSVDLKGAPGFFIQQTSLAGATPAPTTSVTPRPEKGARPAPQATPFGTQRPPPPQGSTPPPFGTEQPPG